MSDEAPAPNHGFVDSRRLTGASRWFAGTAITLTPIGPAALDAAAHLRWAERVAAVARTLGWPDAEPRVVLTAGEALLLAAAPEDQLFTATEISEWAWERSAAEAGVSGFDLAHDLGVDLVAACAEFARRAALERRPALAALRAAAAARSLPVFSDDDSVSIGAGDGCRVWPLAALPDVSDVPWASLHDVPTALVTGSNGKTTTVRLIAAMQRAAGRVAGHCSTTGIEVNGQPIASGDYSGPAGARAVLRHPAVQAAVLETARGGILRRGLAVARADVAVVTNLSADHFGEYGITSLEDLAEVKLTVARVLGRHGTLVLNADDAVLMRAAAALPHAAAVRHALFAADHEHPALAALRQAGGTTCGVQGAGASAELLLSEGTERLHRLGRIATLPLTLGGAARHNIANLAAAALAAWHLGVPTERIAEVAQRFGADPHDNPGRLERWRHRGVTVLVDYAHNPDGLARLLDVARALRPKRLLLLLGQAGNRSDAAIAEMARTAARYRPDAVMLKDMGPTYLRGRALGEVPALLRQALLGSGLPALSIDARSDETAAALALLAAAMPGDVVVLPVHEDAARAQLVATLAGTSR